MDIVIVVVSTIVFGIFSKALVNVPYMIWGIFDWIFAVTFILWLLYMASLYVAAKMQDENGERNWKILLKALLFGTAAALVKMGIDAVTQKIAANQDNMMYAAAIMELEILLFGSAAMLFLYFFAAWYSNILTFLLLLNTVILFHILDSSSVYLLQIHHYILQFHRR